MGQTFLGRAENQGRQGLRQWHMRGSQEPGLISRKWHPLTDGSLIFLLVSKAAILNLFHVVACWWPRTFFWWLSPRCHHLYPRWLLGCGSLDPTSPCLIDSDRVFLSHCVYFLFSKPLCTRILMLGSVSWLGPMSVSQWYHVSFKHMASGFILCHIWMPFMASGRERLISLFGVWFSSFKT